MKQDHIDEFDGLRAIAVVAVMLRHFWHDVAPGFNLGSFGVQMFFVLSGFLITGILLGSVDRIRTQESTVREEMRIFYIRRCLRIFPVYYLVVIITAAMGIPAVRDNFFWHALYLTNFLVSDLQRFPYPSGVFWSLAVEEQFYLLWPAIVLLTPRKLLVPVMVALIVAAIAFRSAMTSLPPVAYHTLLPANMDALIGGALLAVLHRRGANRTLVAATLAALAIAAIILLPQEFIYGTDVSLLATQAKLSMAIYGMAAVHIAAAWSGAPFMAFLRLAPLMYVGKISYGVYLYHQFVGYGAERLGLAGPPFVEFAVKASITILVASASWYAFEKPINNLKRHFPYRRQPMTSQPAMA